MQLSRYWLIYVFYRRIYTMFWVKYDKWKPNFTILIYTIIFLHGIYKLTVRDGCNAKLQQRWRLCGTQDVFSDNNDVSYVHAIRSCDGEQYIPMNMPTVVLCFRENKYSCSSRLPYLNWGNHIIAPVPTNWSRRIWVNPPTPNHQQTLCIILEIYSTFTPGNHYTYCGQMLLNF